jgi:hypothetical protein
MRTCSGSPSFLRYRLPRVRNQSSISRPRWTWLRPRGNFYKCLPITPSSQARDDRSALLLWQRTAVLAGLKEDGGPRSVGEPRKALSK